VLASEFDAPGAPNAAPGAAESPLHDPMAIAPDGKLVWKAALLAQLQHAYDSGKRRVDRLLRIQQRQSALPLRASASAAAAEDDAPEQLDVRDDFAIHLTARGGDRYEWWLGRVLGLFRKSASKSFKTQLNSVSISEPLDDVMVVASWYEPIDATRAVYRRNSVNDTRKYPLGGSCLGCPRLDYDAEARVCRLVDAPGQIRALDESLAGTKPVREGSARTGGEAEVLNARRREQQSAQWEASRAVQAAPRDRAASAAQREAARAEQQRGGGRGRRGGR
jgi:hypothetical protein